MSFQRILITVDESPVAAHAADVGFELGRSLGADVAVIHVMDRSDAFSPESGMPASELMAHAEVEGRRLLDESCARAHLMSPPTTFLPIGKASTEVVKAAKDWHADLIVIGSHGRGGVKRLLIGSVAEAVVRHAPCPVLVVRPAS